MKAIEQFLIVLSFSSCVAVASSAELPKEHPATSQPAGQSTANLPAGHPVISRQSASQPASQPAPLTEEQTQKVKKIMERYNQADQQFAKDNEKGLKAAYEKLGEAHKSGDKKKIQDAMDDLNKALAPRERFRKQAIEELSQVLTPEQFRQLFRFHGGSQAAPEPPKDELNLTAEQKTKINKLMSEAVARGSKAKPEEREQIRKAVWDEICRTVLTKEQLAKVGGQMPGGHGHSATKPTTQGCQGATESKCP